MTRGTRRAKGEPTTRGGSGEQGSLIESLRDDLEAFGLPGYEARVLLALLRAGAATASQLSELSGVGRTSVYPVLEALKTRGLTEPLPGKSGVWGSPGRTEVLGRLCQAQEQRLRDLHQRREQVEAKLAELGPDATGALPYVHLIRGADEIAKVFIRIVSEVRSELLMFTQGPYAEAGPNPLPEVMAMLARGVATRVIYDGSQIADPASEVFRRKMETYHAAGVQARVTDGLPLKLVVADRKRVVMSMADPVVPEVGFLTTLFIEHSGCAALQADAFEARWAAARPYEHTISKLLLAAGHAG